MVASNRHTDHPSHLLQIPGQADHALPIAVVYGANGAGKSNLVKAIAYLERLVLRGTEPKKAIDRQRFLFAADTQQEPTSFELRFCNHEQTYSYGFTVNSTLVLTEWLALVRGAKETSIFERRTDQDGTVVVETGPALDEGHGEHAREIALAKVGARANQLFLTSVRENVESDSQGPLFRGALEWFESVLYVIDPETNFGRLAEWLSDDKEFAEFTGGFLREASTGIDTLVAEKVELTEKQLKEMPDVV